MKNKKIIRSNAKAKLTTLLTSCAVVSLYIATPAQAQNISKPAIDALLADGGGQVKIYTFPENNAQTSSNPASASANVNNQEQNKPVQNIEPASGNGQSFSFGQSITAEEPGVTDSEETPMMPPEEDKKPCCEPDLSAKFELKGGYLPDSDSRSDFTGYAKTSLSATGQINDNLDFKASLDIDHIQETGGHDFSETDVRYDENYLRYKNGNFSTTLGAQRVIWGRVDDIKPTDQLGPQDLRTFITNDYEERRMAVPALRSEYTMGDYKLDGLFVADLRQALPDQDSLWSFIDKDNGKILGVKTDPALTPLIQNATIDDDVSGIGGGGIRFSKTGDSADWAVTAQRARRNTPFYAVNPQILSAIQAGTPPAAALAGASGKTLEARYDWGWVMGGDIAIPIGSTILRAEGAWITDVPLHTTALNKTEADMAHIVAGAEFYPGDGDLRIIAQAAAVIYPDADNVIERTETYSINGTIHNEFDQGRWNAELDYAAGLNRKDIYLNPKISYKGLNSHELFVEYHFFDGNEETAGGFYKNNSALMLGWKYQL